MRGKTKHSDDEDDSTKLGTTGYPQAKTNEGKEQEQDDEHADNNYILDENGKEVKQDEIDCGKSMVRKLIGPKGAVIQEISRRSGCEITIPDRFQNSDELKKVKISSSNEDSIEVAKSLIGNVMEHGQSALNGSNTPNTPLEFMTMGCPQDKVASVIGARGTVINDIMRRTGCRVVINQDVAEGEVAIVEMSGHQPQLNEVKMLVNKVIEDGPQSISLSPLLGLSTGPNANRIVTDVMEIPKFKVGVAIGTKGVIIQEIMRRTTCKIVIDQDVPDGQPCRVHFSGLPTQVQSAKTILSSVIKYGPTALYSPSLTALGFESLTVSGFEQGGPTSTQEIIIDQIHVGKILGTRGSIVKELQSKFSVRIKIDTVQNEVTSTEETIVKVYGQMRNVQQACQMIYNIIEFGPESALGGKGKGERSPTRHRAATYPTPMYAVQPLANMPQVGGMYYSEYPQNIPPVEQFSHTGPKAVQMSPHTAVPQGTMGLGAEGGSGVLFPMATMPNGLQNQTAIIKNDCIYEVVGKNASTLNLIKSKSGAQVQSVQTATSNAETSCEISMIGTPMEVELASQMVQEVLTSGKGKIEALPDVPSSAAMMQPPMVPVPHQPQQAYIQQAPRQPYIQSYTTSYAQHPSMVAYGASVHSVPVYNTNNNNNKKKGGHSSLVQGPCY